ncbi:kinase-like domain-containing protein [Boletus edulis]|nr:kinase-like domain-containing protein [Boletus edulis]
MHNGSLHHFLEKHDDNLGVEHRLQFLQDIANGLQYLHYFSVVHGDLNCNNVLLDADYSARLADFGYASMVGNIPEALGYLQRSTARPGALRWSPPEQILSEETFMRTTKSDIYSFGCVALQVLSGKRPWSELQEEAAIVLRVAKGHKPGRPKSRMMDDSHWCLIQECWSPLEERPTAEVIKSAIQQFLNDGPRSPSLHDLIQSWSSQVDHGAEFLSSPSEVPAHGSSARFAQTLDDEHSISDTSSSYQPHEDEEYHTSLIAKRGRSTEVIVPSDDKHYYKRRRM